MPILNSDYPNRKIWRPNGTKYAVGKLDSTVAISPSRTRDKFLSICAGIAIERAHMEFYLEFGRHPDVEDAHLVAELTYTTSGVTATIFELPDES